MSACTGAECACGCCQGTAGLTPVDLVNRPGLSALAYRVGIHPSFKETMLAEISAQPALGALATRDDDDPTIALLDAWAVTLDVLTFYQERIANEGYLRTATERRSILELARTIGYELRPGVAASTWLAFTLDGAPGSPREVNIPAGTRAQSLPTKTELPQSFETGRDLLARPEWNALHPRQTEPQTLQGTEILLAGVATQLRPGDALLIVAVASTAPHPGDFRILTAVEARPDAGVTRVAWKKEEPLTVAANLDLAIFALRQRAGLFGANAPDWKAMTKEFKEAYVKAVLNETYDSNIHKNWPKFEIQTAADRKIDLDAAYSRIAPESWVVLVAPDTATAGKSIVNRRKVNAVETIARAEFALSARVTRVTLDVALDASVFGLRETAVFAESEELKPALQVIAEPVTGKKIELDGLVGGLLQGRNLIVQGKPMRVKMNVNGLELAAEDGSGSVRLFKEATLQVLAAPVSGTWHLRDRNGYQGIVTPADTTSLTLIPSEEDDLPVAEPAVLGEATPDDAQTHVTLHLAEDLVNLFDRATVSVLANVAPATHGETRREVLGSGDAAKRFQRFRLRQKPLTYTAAPVPSGGESTLELRVGGVLWHEASDFFQLGRRDRKYVLRRDDEGNTTARFGDGVHGARLPTGVENVEAVYRTGIGHDGVVGASRIALLATRPLGVKSVINPVAATGGADPELRDQARRNAPTTVLTLDRVVSLRDFEDFARAFSGIAKAQARELWDSGRQIVHLTVAGIGGSAVDPASATYQNLRAAMDRQRDPFQALIVESFDRLLFRLRLRVKVDPDRIAATVLARVETALRDAFSFDARDFGQSVALSEVMAVAQRVEGVIYVDVDAFHQEGMAEERKDRITARPARIDDAGAVQRAQILLLSPVPVAPEAIS